MQRLKSKCLFDLYSVFDIKTIHQNLLLAWLNYTCINEYQNFSRSIKYPGVTSGFYLFL